MLRKNAGNKTLEKKKKGRILEKRKGGTTEKNKGLKRKNSSLATVGSSV